MPQIVGNNGLDALNLADQIAVGGAYNGAKVQLYMNDVVPARNKVRGDYTNAVYDGAAQGAITWGTPSIADDGTPEVIGTVPAFKPTGAVTSCVVFGGVIVSGADALLSAFRATAPVPMASANDVYIVTIRLRVQNYGLVVEVS